MVLYRILSMLVNVFCALLALITVFGIIYAIANPAALLQCFLFIGTVLYGWFASRFRTQVILRNQVISKRYKDWLQVNAIVAFIFSLLGVSNGVYIYRNPNVINDILKQLPPEVGASGKMLTNISTGLLVCCLVLLIHVIWTLTLVRKHSEHFEG